MRRTQGRRPLITRAAIAPRAPHLGNALPEWYDVVSLGFYAIRSNQEKLSVCAKPRRDRPVAQVLGAEERSVTVTNWPPQAREG